jgi:hypothetical protein
VCLSFRGVSDSVCPAGGAEPGVMSAFSGRLRR